MERVVFPLASPDWRVHVTLGPQTEYIHTYLVHEPSIVFIIIVREPGNEFSSTQQRLSMA